MLALLLALSSTPAHADAPPPADTVPNYNDPQARLQAQVDVVKGLIDAGMYPQALKVVRQVRDAGASGPELDVMEAHAMLNVGMRDDAEVLLRKVVKKQPRNADALSLLGVALADAHKLDESISVLAKASRIRKDDPEILNNLGYAHMAHGDLEEAVRLFRASLAENALQARTRNNLGFALARLERDGEALEAFRAAGDEADARYNMGVACEQRSDKAIAIANYQAAIAANPDHAAAKTALNRLLSQGSP